MAVSHPFRRFGKKPPRDDHRTLRLAKYITKLPAVPASCDHASKVLHWPMDGNNDFGDCVLAAAEHAIRDWTAYAGADTHISESQVIALYRQLSPNDDGLVMLDTLNLWRKSGLWADQIDAYAALDVTSIDQARAAIYLFGSVSIGMALPDTNTFGPWTMLSGPKDEANGHAVILVGYDDASMTFTVVTWGQTMPMSYAWYVTYVEEAYAILSRDWLGAQGSSPDGFDYAALAADLAGITGSAPPEPPPPPPQPPIPPNPAPGCLSPAGVKHVVSGLHTLIKYIEKHTT